MDICSIKVWGGSECVGGCDVFRGLLAPLNVTKAKKEKQFKKK